MYVNDISNYTSLKLLSFADDTTISCSSPDINNLYNIVNEELDALNQWFYANKFTVHEQYTFLPSDLQNYAFRAGRHAFHTGKNGRICKHAAKSGESTDIYTNL